SNPSWQVDAVLVDAVLSDNGVRSIVRERKQEMTTSNATLALIAAIRSGDITTVRRLLDENPGLASSALGGDEGTRTPLHVVTDWPGYFPNGPEVVRILIAAGANPDARNPGKRFAETPLHWAASSDDADVAS